MIIMFLNHFIIAGKISIVQNYRKVVHSIKLFLGLMQMYYQHLKLLNHYHYSSKFLFQTTSDAMISPIISGVIWTNLLPVASNSLK